MERQLRERVARRKAAESILPMDEDDESMSVDSSSEQPKYYHGDRECKDISRCPGWTRITKSILSQKKRFATKFKRDTKYRPSAPQANCNSVTSPAGASVQKNCVAKNSLDDKNDVNGPAPQEETRCRPLAPQEETCSRSEPPTLAHSAPPPDPVK
jgi:hypothetical protein